MPLAPEPVVPACSRDKDVEQQQSCQEKQPVYDEGRYCVQGYVVDLEQVEIDAGVEYERTERDVDVSGKAYYRQPDSRYLDVPYGRTGGPDVLDDDLPGIIGGYAVEQYEDVEYHQRSE